MKRIQVKTQTSNLIRVSTRKLYSNKMWSQSSTIIENKILIKLFCVGNSGAKMQLQGGVSFSLGRN